MTQTSPPPSSKAITDIWRRLSRPPAVDLVQRLGYALAAPARVPWARSHLVCPCPPRQEISTARMRPRPVAAGCL